MTARRPIIIGCTGSLGRWLTAETRARGRDFIATSRRAGDGYRCFDAEADDLVDVVPDLGGGDCVYLAFGLANPSWVCTHAATARAVNVDATVRVIDRALERGARTVFFSSEMVFDGRTGGYDEASVPAPITEYGRQKVAVERHLLDRDGDWVIVRIGANVTEGVGENCVVEKTYASLLRPGAKMAPDNVISLSQARDTARALLALSERGESGVYHFVADQPVSRVELASWVIADSQFASRMRYEESPYADIPFPEPRPPKSYMIGPKTYPRLGIKFSSPRDAIRRKVALLDARREAEQEATLQ